MYQRGNILSSLPPVTKVFLLINIVVFILSYFAEQSGFRVENILALHNFKPSYFYQTNIEGFQPNFFNPVQIVTHMFMHGSLTHIFFNMFGLFLFGRVLEGVLGSKKFFILYVVAGLGSAFLQLGINYLQNSQIALDVLQYMDNPGYNEWWRLVNKLNFDTITSVEYRGEVVRFAQAWVENPDNVSYATQSKYFLHNIFGVYVNIPMVGASGAIMGILAAFALMFPNVELMLIFLPIPIKAKYFVPIFMVLELFLGVANFSFDNIAHFAHLGGAIAGFILAWYWKKNQFSNHMY